MAESDPRAEDRARLEQGAAPAPDLRARASLERALARGRQLWPNGPTAELVQWARLDGMALGGAPALAFASARAAAAQAQLSPDMLLLAAAGYGDGTPALVARHLERAGRVA